MLTLPVAGVDVIVGKYLGPGDVLLAYLPAAHILEFVFENAVLYWGGTLGYGTIRTLSDTSVRNCAGDIRELKPTVLVGVPQVWETVKKGIVRTSCLVPVFLAAASSIPLCSTRSRRLQEES
jgi:long-chain acyl-CoA synthetase